MNAINRAKHTILSILKYPSIIRRLKSSDSEFVFFFPHYHTGGGEQVHADIMNTIKDKSPVCLITAMSMNEDLKGSFEASADVIQLLRWGSKREFKKFMAVKIAHILNKKKNLTVFTSNSIFFDLVVPHLNEDIRKIDLIHTFLGDRKEEAEQRTLSHVHLLQNRVVLGERQKQLTSAFYAKQGLDPLLTGRLRVIPNKVEIVNINTSRDYPSSTLDILFVSRNSSEKRPQLFVDIARQAYERRLPMKFIMIGDFESFDGHVTSNVKLLGRIKDKNQLNTYYSSSHLILVTSLFEGFPMVLLEGMSLGVVPISTRVGEVPFHINEESKTGYIIDNDLSESETVEAFIAKLTWLYSNQDVLERNSAAVKALVSERFNEDKFRNSYRSLLLGN